jgi:hypothetical protein
MFERATVFSTILISLIFGIIGLKYLDFIESKNQLTKTSINYEQQLINHSS